MQLLILTKIQKEKKIKNNITNQLTKLLSIFKPYNKNNKLSIISVFKISNI